ncbi:aspartate-semialdehyde dehydrogenase [Candidatus Sulfidibacterium hydrothermale]|uniref:aspartate-semialdehyde dehydrogenase n=1 Tax=Candidatus Sulfidibacterium hydrothermale TaxID=2875962 RepID=UPI001F0A86AE|nr:aspartate-semialdehyde dehydrogenase [Candidatus Sulfidibacterium hydrothermale]UBM62735.1 aspartate-semialdehyde dehydrogenase [Candidatus Sulfidibacterium hydrothermale]
MKVAIVGATGLVGRKMIQVLEERNFPLTRLYAVASEKSEGKKVPFKQSEIEVITPEKAVKARPDIALFSAGASVSRQWAPQFAAEGTIVIDNSSAWRMDPDKPLIVPEINGNVLRKTDKIIANPNCSTIQMLMAIAPLHRKFGIRRIVVSTYQSVSGSGKKGVDQLMSERQNRNGEKIYPHVIDLNTLPHAGDFLDNGYTTEEEKLVNETRKILGDETIAVSATAVRVPVIGGHSESINLELRKPFRMDEVRFLLKEMSGLVVLDDPEKNLYPMPVYAHEKDEVFVGRIRRDPSIENGINLWVVADNLRKGAATNAVQIAEFLLKQKLLG